MTVLLASPFVIVRRRNLTCHGPSPVNVLTLVALLFTARLDMGLVMLPRTDLPIHAAGAEHAFTTPPAALYIYFENGIVIPGRLNAMMIFVVFVINSLDSLIRLCSANLDRSIGHLGPARYYPLHFGLQLAPVLTYQVTPVPIEWVGLVVIGLYLAVVVAAFRRPAPVRAALRDRAPPQTV